MKTTRLLLCTWGDLTVRRARLHHVGVQAHLTGASMSLTVWLSVLKGQYYAMIQYGFASRTVNPQLGLVLKKQRASLPRQIWQNHPNEKQQGGSIQDWSQWLKLSPAPAFPLPQLMQPLVQSRLRPGQSFHQAQLAFACLSAQAVLCLLRHSRHLTRVWLIVGILPEWHSIWGVNW